MHYADSIDYDRAGVLARVHDDHEQYALLGDVTLSSKLQMSKKELAHLKVLEREAIDHVVSQIPLRFHAEYKALLLTAHRKDTLESQLIAYLDKADALGESLHEIAAGNGNIFFPAAATYLQIFSNFGDQYPDLLPFLSQNHPLLTIPSFSDILTLETDAAPHTKVSLTKATGLHFYDQWRTLSRRKFGDEILTTVREQALLPAQ